jgi:hypothetical protein
MTERFLLLVKLIKRLQSALQPVCDVIPFKQVVLDSVLLLCRKTGNPAILDPASISGMTDGR